MEFSKLLYVMEFSKLLYVYYPDELAVHELMHLSHSLNHMFTFFK